MAVVVAQSPTWELTPARLTPLLGPVLRIGARALPVSEIKGFIASADRDTDKNPAFVTLAVFGIAALFFLLGHLDLGWRQRFLAAAVLFGAIAVSALHDMAWLTTSGIYRVEVMTRSGETVRYATVNAAEQDALIDALSAIVGSRRPTAANDDLAAPQTQPASMT